MRALCWYGARDVRVRSVADPTILEPRDALLRVTSSAICGSDLHLYHGFVPTMRRGDVLGHEFMGEVLEVGSAVENLAPGDRVVVPFPISCGACWFCRREEFSLCDNSNPNAWLAEPVFGHAPAGIYGYSHLMGGYPGGQAELVRVPFADIGPIRIEDDLPDERVLLLSDILPTAWMAAELCAIQEGDVVAIWGCGPVGTLAIRCALLQGAAAVLAIDRVDARLALARRSGAETIDLREDDVLAALRDRTGGRGPDACIDAVGLEGHGKGLLQAYDRAAQTIRFETDRPAALREAIIACRKGGVVVLAGAYAGFADKIPLGAAFNKALRLRMGQTHVQRYLRPLLERVRAGELDASDVISHRLPLEDAPYAYDLFATKGDECTKVVLKP